MQLSIFLIVTSVFGASQEFLKPDSLEDKDLQITADVTVYSTGDSYFWGFKVPTSNSVGVYTFGLRFVDGVPSLVEGTGCDDIAGDCHLLPDSQLQTPWNVGNPVTLAISQNENQLKVMAGQLSEDTNTYFNNTINGVTANLSNFEVLQNNLATSSCPGNSSAKFENVRYIDSNFEPVLPVFGNSIEVNDANKLPCSRDKEDHLISLDSDGSVEFTAGILSTGPNVEVGQDPLGEDKQGDQIQPESENLQESSTESSFNGPTTFNDNFVTIEAKGSIIETLTIAEPTEAKVTSSIEEIVLVPTKVITTIEGKPTTFVSLLKIATDDSEKGKKLKAIAAHYSELNFK